MTLGYVNMTELVEAENKRTDLKYVKFYSSLNEAERFIDTSLYYIGVIKFNVVGILDNDNIKRLTEEDKKGV